MIDAHIHLDDQRFDADRTELISQANDAGISQFITPAVMAEGFKKLTALSQQHHSIVPSYGLHPYYVELHQKDDLKYLDLYLSTHQSCAVGECGLDFFLKDLDKDKQRFYCAAQIELAKKHDLPLILHARGAIDAVYAELKNANYFNAMIHSYNGSIEQTRQLIDKGLKFSFGGAICNPNAHKLHKLIKYCPLDAVMFETDAPDQHPYPDFKERNVPSQLTNVIKHYAMFTENDFDYVMTQSIINIQDFFNLNR